MVSFRREDRERVAMGEITVTFRLWKTPKVRPGNRYATGFGTIEVDDVQVIPAALVSQDDVALTGCSDIQAIWDLAGDHTHTSVGPDTMLHRVRFRYLGDEPAPSRASPLAAEAVATRLAQMDRRSVRGAWTHRVLELIDTCPRVPARVLAAELQWETLDFKAHVRRLKALGLTISHEVGYEVSGLGRRYLDSVRETAAARKVTRPPRDGAARSPRTRRRSR